MKSYRVFSLMSFLLALLVLQGCAGLTANTVSDGADKHLGLKGHDPVAYFTVGKHMLGDANIKMEHEGVTYRFTSEDHKKMFADNPIRFAPQYGGYCANGIVYGIPWGGDPDTWRIVNDRLLFLAARGRSAIGRWKKNAILTWATNIGATKLKVRRRSFNVTNAWCSACRTIKPAPNWKLTGKPNKARANGIIQTAIRRRSPSLA